MRRAGGRRIPVIILAAVLVLGFPLLFGPDAAGAREADGRITTSGTYGDYKKARYGRYFNVYGENEFYKGKTASMILQLGLQALQNKKVRLFKMGEQKRDFVYIQDVIQANIKAMFAKKSGVYNVGSGVARSYNDIVSCLKQELGNFEVEYFDNPYQFFQTHTQANIILTQEFLDYTPRFSLEIGIKNYLKQIKEIHTKGSY